MRMLFVSLLLIGQPSSLIAADEDDQQRFIEVVVGVLAQADRIPPEFSEQAEEKLNSMPPTALPHLLRLMNQLPTTTVERLDRCGSEIIRQAKMESLEIPETYVRKFAESDRQSPAARRVAIGWLEIHTPGVREPFLLSRMSEQAFRHDAIDVVLSKHVPTQDDKRRGSIPLLKTAFAEVQDPVQAERLTAALKEHGISVSADDQLGVIHEWTCESTVDPPVIRSGALQGLDSVSVPFKRASSELFTHVVLEQKIQPGRIVLRSVIHSDIERDVQLRITCTGTPHLHLNGEELTLAQSPSEICGIQSSTAFQRTIHLQRGSNEAAFKLFETTSDLEAEVHSADVRFCVQIVDDNGRGFHAPQVFTSRDEKTELTPERK